MIYTTRYVSYTNILINQKMIKIAGIYDSITVSLLQIIYIWQKRYNNQHYMLANPDYKKCNHQLQMIMIAYVYVRINCICHPLIESIIS